MTDIALLFNYLLRITTFLSILVFVGAFLLGGVKFFRIWRNLREESLFHLSMLCFGLLLYIIFIGILVLLLEDEHMVDFLIKHVLGLIFTPLYLEVSLYYLTTYINRRNLWEKYIPFVFGIMVGISLLLFTLPSSDPYFGILSAFAYGIPVILTSILLARICIRSYSVFKESDLSDKDKSFIFSFTILAIAMFFGSLFDASFFIIIAVTEINLWPILIPLSGTLGPVMAVIVLIYIRKVFSMIDDADILYVMNILS
jgi:hypothetical protein